MSLRDRSTQVTRLVGHLDVSLVLFVMFTYWLLGLTAKPNTSDVISYIYVVLTGISMLIVGIVVFGNIAKQRLQQIQELENKKEE